MTDNAHREHIRMIGLYNRSPEDVLDTAIVTALSAATSLMLTDRYQALATVAGSERLAMRAAALIRASMLRAQVEQVTVEHFRALVSAIAGLAEES
jgi:hypothetical protein